MTSTSPDLPPGQHRSSRSLTSRTSLVTAAAIAGVLIAGTAAVAANIGILNAADSSDIGELAATDELLPTTGAAAGTPPAPPVPPSTASTTVPPNGVQQYDIEGSGSVWLLSTTSGLALDHVVAQPGWNSVLSQGDLRSLRVDFTNGDRTIVFTAAVGDDGAVVVDVTEPTTVLADNPGSVPAPSLVGPAPTFDDDDHEDDDEYDDHEYDDDDDDDHEEDDDHDEYEGADDDD
jgi:hypothetical protein